MSERAFAPVTAELRAHWRHAEFTIAGLLPAVRHAEFTIAGLLPAVRHAELVSASMLETVVQVEKWTLKQVQGDGVVYV